MLRWLLSLGLSVSPRNYRRSAMPGRGKGGRREREAVPALFALSRQGFLQRVPGGGDPVSPLPRPRPARRLHERLLAGHQAEQLVPAAAGEGASARGSLGAALGRLLPPAPPPAAPLSPAPCSFLDLLICNCFFFFFFSFRVKFLAKQEFDITQELIDGTIHCKPGAAERLLRELCSALTSSR